MNGTDTETRPLPTIGQFRTVGRIQEGWQVLNGAKYEQDGTEEWWTVTSAMHITAPLRVSHFEFDSGVKGGVPSRDEFFCRTPSEIKRAAAKR